MAGGVPTKPELLPKRALIIVFRLRHYPRGICDALAHSFSQPMCSGERTSYTGNEGLTPWLAICLYLISVTRLSGLLVMRGGLITPDVQR